MSEFLSLNTAFAYFTECNLATAERLQTLSRSSKWERQRQTNIITSMVQVCRDFNIAPMRNTPRLAKALTATSPVNPQEK